MLEPFFNRFVQHTGPRQIKYHYLAITEPKQQKRRRWHTNNHTVEFASRTRHITTRSSLFQRFCHAQSSQKQPRIPTTEIFHLDSSTHSHWHNPPSAERRLILKLPIIHKLNTEMIISRGLFMLHKIMQWRLCRRCSLRTLIILFLPLLREITSVSMMLVL